MTLAPDEIAFPRGVSDLKKWRDAATIYKKGTPIHVRGCLLYNNMLDEMKLTRKQTVIKEGEADAERANEKTTLVVTKAERNKLFAKRVVLMFIGLVLTAGGSGIISFVLAPTPLRDYVLKVIAESVPQHRDRPAPPSYETCCIRSVGEARVRHCSEGVQYADTSDPTVASEHAHVCCIRDSSAHSDDCRGQPKLRQQCLEWFCSSTDWEQSRFRYMLRVDT